MTGLPATPHIVIFDSSSPSSTISPLSHSILISCRDGPQKLTGLVKRGRPRKERQASPTGQCNEELLINEFSPTSKFSFVTYTASPQNAGPTFQRLVRRRAMLDYRRQEREQKSASEAKEKSKAGFRVNQAFHEAKKDEDEILQQCNIDNRMNSASPTTSTYLLSKEITAVEPFNAFPFKIEPYMLELLSSYTNFIYETMYTIEKHVNLNPARDYWLPMAFQDAALLHAFIFCADGHGTISQGRKEGPAAVIHLREAIQIVNERLRAPVPCVSDATIAVICTFAHTEILNGNHENWMIHMRGLKQMLLQRGGMQAFESNRLLRSKISRADLCGSIAAVRSPYFEFVVRDLPTAPGYREMTRITTTGFSRISNSIKLDKKLTQILYEIQDVTYNLNMFHLHQTQMHPLSLREAVTSSQYSLLSFEVQQRREIRENLVHETLQLGLLMYLITLLNESPTGISLYDKLGAKLKSALIEVRQNDGLNLEISLWIMFIAASMVKDLEIRGHFMASAAEIIDELGFSCWGDVRALFKSFFWVEKIHEGTLKPIWNEIEATIKQTG